MDSTNDNTRSEHNNAGADSKNAAGGAAAVDVQLLAEKVYRLMRDELRLERARGAAGPKVRKR